MNRTLQSRHRSDNPSLPLFEAAERARVRALPLAARRLANRHSLPPATARTVAELIGYSLEGRQ
jgi:hypothetical protein